MFLFWGKEKLMPKSPTTLFKGQFTQNWNVTQSNLSLNADTLFLAKIASNCVYAKTPTSM